ncbi:hypothetical protein Taro_000059 [Colocasia esculenta]|uniref:Uncharacterized protein n=1 Tax=Colocasia esculenta TaxID=4460 RepID=A0A843TDS2_COLES|nr:hypothetical protein [Colocasia esculenta]
MQGFLGVDTPGTMASRLMVFGPDLTREWNKSVFKNFIDNVMLGEEAHTIAQTIFDGDSSPENHVQLSVARDDLARVHVQEEMFWRQKSRLKWLKEGDGNTKFFHAYAASRRRRSTIKQIYNDDGLVVTDKDDMVNLFVSHFSTAFASTTHYVDHHMVEVIPELVDDRRNDLLCVVPASISPRIVRWYLPPLGRLKLNVDGAYKISSGTAAGGAIVRNGIGDIILHFLLAILMFIRALRLRRLPYGMEFCCVLKGES